MKFVIKHEMSGRIRIHMVQAKMSFEQADTLLYFLEPGCLFKIIIFKGDRFLTPFIGIGLIAM